MRTLLLFAALAVPLAAAADEAPVLFGGDGYASAPVLTLRVGAPGDLFAAGARVRLDAPTGGDVHAVGFSVGIDGETGENLYAAGSNVDLRASVGGDANLVGGSVAVADGVEIGGNARISGGSILFGGIVSGAAALAGGEITVGGTVAGDLRVTAAALAFEEGASIGGDLVYTTPEPIAIPASVVDASRVRHVPAGAPAWPAEGFEWEASPPTLEPWAVAGGALVTVAFLLVLGAVLLALAPRKVATMRRMAHERPGMTMLLGLVGLSTLFGLIFVSAISIVGIPLVPIVILTLILAWLLGYLLGAYVLAMAVARGLGMGDAPSIWARIGVLAVAIVGAALLNFIPLIGWMANLALVLLGVGAFTDAALAAMIPRTGPDLDVDMRGPEPEAGA